MPRAITTETRRHDQAIFLNARLLVPPRALAWLWNSSGLCLTLRTVHTMILSYVVRV